MFDHMIDILMSARLLVWGIIVLAAGALLVAEIRRRR